MKTVHLSIERMLPLRHGTGIEHASIAHQLGLSSPDAAESASSAGYLRIADIPNVRGATTAWVVSDPSRHAAEMRHLTGPAFSDQVASPTNRVVFGDRQWPVGAGNMKIGIPVVFTRGAEDLIAAFLVMKQFTVVGMLDDEPIAAGALHLFHERRVLLAELADPVAQKAFAVWRQQLIAAGAFVHTLEPVGFDGRRYYLNGSGKIAGNLLDWARTGYPVEQPSDFRFLPYHGTAERERDSGNRGHDNL